MGAPPGCQRAPCGDDGGSADFGREARAELAARLTTAQDRGHEIDHAFVELRRHEMGCRLMEVLVQHLAHHFGVVLPGLLENGREEVELFLGRAVLCRQFL